MSRPSIPRNLVSPPSVLGFKPYGVSRKSNTVIVLTLDEFQAFRLIDYEHIQQLEAAAKMGISRPTFTRIYNRALSKLATAFVEGKTISIEGGKVCYGKDWLKCTKCQKIFENRESHLRCSNCSVYGFEELVSIEKTHS
jgi:predicted DNA-binding protein (UPF0251 family)